MPGTETKTIEGIVLRLVEQKENDFMVSAIGPEGLFSFYAHGVQKISSKNGGAVQALSHSKFTLNVGKNSSYSLKESEAIESFLVSDNLAALSVLSFIEEVSSKIIQPDEAVEDYKWLLASLEALKSGGDPFTIGLIYLAHLLTNGGIGLDVDECVICQSKKDIVALSYQDGGFACANCFDPGTMKKAEPRKLKMLRYIFRCGISDIPRVSFAKEECLNLYEELSQYLNDLTGTQLKSLSILTKL